ncbi:MAG: transglycosylase domain-containing protein [Candidatus Paceibacterota bacterium]|jgi:penicillin-binding protein 1A|nr:transglycosylase domain-containing protein [Candidatus Paceibacterota bacterium]
MAKRKTRRRFFNKENKWHLALKIILGCFLFSVFFVAAVFVYFAKDLPRPELFTEKPFVLPTKIYDSKGETLLYQIYGEEKRTVVSLDQISDNLEQAVLAAEDSNFYNHFGLDIEGIMRSVFKNIQTGTLNYGGSTLTQQLIRSSFLTLDKTASRKIKEIILSLELERRYSKDEILSFYLNQVPFGSNCYGVEAASQTFFNKPAADVSLEEAALLASLINGTTRFSPYGSHVDELYARRDYVLDRMVALKYITEDEANEAKEGKAEFAESTNPIKAPHFALYVREYLEDNYSDYFLQTKGLKVYTTLDWELQQAAETAIQNGVEHNKYYNAHNAGLVAIDPNTGEVLAMVGSANWYEAESYPEGCIPGKTCLFEPKLNVTVYGGGRQPGSSFKPFAYARAFKDGLTPDTIVWDVKTEFNPNCTSTSIEEKDQFDGDCYHPKNYTGDSSGPVTLREALAQSINVPAVKVLYLAGLSETIDLAKSMGITTLNQEPSWYGLSLVLGGGEVRLIDMVSAYGVFATEGYSIPPVFISKIEDSEGNIIEENNRTPKKVLDTQTARLINDVLSDNEARAPLFGWNSPLYFPGYDVAVKTGTTQEYKDAWTVGYTTSVVAGVWAGNNDGTLPDQKPGLVLASPIWNEFMQTALELYPSSEFNEPAPAETEKPALNGEIDEDDPHSILHYVDRFDPLGDEPEKPELNAQYTNWEEAVKAWITNNPGWVTTL